jgi:NAD(P)H dehydrogenase (quinone)
LANTPRSYEEIAQATKVAMNGELDIKSVSKDVFTPDLVLAGISKMWIGVSENYQQYTLNEGNGENLADNSEFEQVLGHPLTKLSEAVKEFL